MQDDRSFPIVLGVLLLLTVVLSAGSARSDEPARVHIAVPNHLASLVGELVAAYRTRYPERPIEVISGDDAAAIDALLRRTADLAAVVGPLEEEPFRRIRDSRQASPVGTPIALDAVALVVHKSNPLATITVEELRAIFSYKLNGWAKLGVSLPPAPDHRHTSDCKLAHPKEALIHRQIPADGSGYRKMLKMRVMSGADIPRGRDDHGSLRDVVNAVRSDKLGLGITAVGSAQGVRILPIRLSADAPPITPTADTISARTYPLVHYLYLYSAGPPTGSVKDFLTFVVSADGQRVVEASGIGVVPLPFWDGAPAP